MAKGYRASAVVEAPVEVVWQVMADVEAMPEWTTSMSSVTIKGGGPIGPGSKVAVRQPKLPPATWVVEQWEPNHRFTWASSGPGVRTWAEHTVTPRADGTSEVVLRIESTGLLAGPMWRLIAGLTRDYVDRELAGLKRRSEEHGSARS